MSALMPLWEHVQENGRDVWRFERYPGGYEFEHHHPQFWGTPIGRKECPGDRIEAAAMRWNPAACKCCFGVARPIWQALGMPLPD